MKIAVLKLTGLRFANIASVNGGIIISRWIETCVESGKRDKNLNGANKSELK